MGLGAGNQFQVQQNHGSHGEHWVRMMVDGDVSNAGGDNDDDDSARQATDGLPQL